MSPIRLCPDSVYSMPWNWTSASANVSTSPFSAAVVTAIERHEREVAQRQAPPSRRLERGIGLVLTALSVLGLIGSRSIDVRVDSPGVGPQWWPTMLSVIALLISAVLAVLAFTRPPSERSGLESATRGGRRRLGLTVVIIALFVVAWTGTGNFLVPCVLMLVALLLSYGSRSWKALVVFPVLTTAIIYLLFHLLLRIPL